MQRLVTDRHVTDPLFGRPLRDAPGLNMRNLLAAIANRVFCCVDTEKVLNAATTGGDGRVSRVMEGVYHAEGGGDGGRCDFRRGRAVRHWK